MTTTTVIKTRGVSGLYVDTTAVSKKYLGEPGDRHFIPNSPIISRQLLTPWEEAELMRSCCILLEGVPHSDDSSTNEFKHLASHITAHAGEGRRHRQKAPSSEKTNKFFKHSATSSATNRNFIRTGFGDDTATPSSISRSVLFDKTDVSTPMTSSEVTPDEVYSRHADHSYQGSATQICYISSKPRKFELTSQSPSAKRSQTNHLAAKSLTSLPASNRSHADHVSYSRPLKTRKQPVVRRPEYNKSLPNIPSMDNVFPVVDAATPILAPSEPKARHNPARVKRIATEPCGLTEDDQPKKSKFSLLTLFGKKKKTHGKQQSATS